MNINDALDLIDQMATTGVMVTTQPYSTPGSKKQWISGKADFDQANKIALDAVADHAVKRVKRFLDAPYPPASQPGEAPAKRTGTLQDSIHWRVGRESRQFPGPSGSTLSDLKRFKAKSPDDYDWYKKIRREAYTNNSIITPYPQKTRGSSVVRVVEVNPRAVDRSDRQRLEYYSYFLETGWWSKPNQLHRDKGTGVPSATGNSGRSGKNSRKANVGPKWNPPRPYIRRLSWPVYRNELKKVYQNALRSSLPGPLKFLADKAELQVRYTRSLRVPFYADHK